MKAIDLYFPVVLFIVLYKVILTFEIVDEILQCDNSTESYIPVSVGFQSFPHRDFGEYIKKVCLH